MRFAEHKDVPAIAQLFGAYFHMTPWRHWLEYDEQKTINRLHQLIDGKVTPHLLAFDGPNLVGLISWHYDSAYVTRSIAVMDETYCHPQYRGTDLGRKLVALALCYAKADDAAVMNFPIASGLPEMKTLTNMLKRKFGGKICGILVRCEPQGEFNGR